MVDSELPAEPAIRGPAGPGSRWSTAVGLMRGRRGPTTGDRIEGHQFLGGDAVERALPELSPAKTRHQTLSKNCHQIGSIGSISRRRTSATWISCRVSAGGPPPL